MLEYLRLMIKHPRKIGCIMPSSPEHAQNMAVYGLKNNPSSIIEIGPGMGTITKQILDSKNEDASYAAIELDTKLQEKLQDNYPEHKIIEGNAKDIESIIEYYGLEHPQSIISSLPWASIRSEYHEEILNPLYNSLEEGGAFVTYAYKWSLRNDNAMHFKDLLGKVFDNNYKIHKSKNNLPSIIYEATKKAQE